MHLSTAYSLIFCVLLLLSQLQELPFGHVPLPDMDRVVDAFNGEYGDIPPWGHGPDPHQMSPDKPHAEAYLSSKFPALDYLRGCSKHVAQTCLQDTTLSTDDLLRLYGSTHIQHIPCGRQQDFLSLHAIPGTGSAYDTVYARLSKVQNPAWGVFFLFSSLFLLWYLFRWCSSKSTGTLTGVAIVGNGGGLLGVERTITATGGATTVLQDLELGRVGIRRPIEGIDNPFQDRKCE